MTVREMSSMIDELVKVYVCDETGIVIDELSNLDWTDPLLDREVVGISTYNYGIELDVRED